MGWNVRPLLEGLDEETFRRERLGQWSNDHTPFRAPARSTPTPQLVGTGPVEFTTCTDLLKMPVLIHDVNGYYRALGVHPRATRRELREAYQRKGGPSNAYLTYVFKQLLNPQVRAEYDRCPLGRPYLDDYWMAWISAQAKAKAARAAARARQLGIDLDSQEAERAVMRKVYDAMGVDATWDDEDAPDEAVDNDGPGEKDRALPARDSLPRFGYSYYQWRSRCDDIERLAVWQDLLVRAFSRRGLSARMAVGFHGRLAHPWVLARVGYRTVVFLNDREVPTAADAAAVAARVAEDQRQQTREMHP